MEIKTQKRILIVNRGEIAIRIAKAVRELGHIAIGVWTSYGEDEGHLEYCHEWIQLKGQTNLETYLNKDQLLKVALENKIDMVHPGYGFLSENSDFVDLLENNNITFIGPNSKVIRLMGDKAISKECALLAGVPVIPGSKGVLNTLDEVIHCAEKIGFPVLLKAVAGGGGKGMRICHSINDLKNHYTTVKNEALSSFGNDQILLEKYVVNPKHIEVQILADKKGNVFHLFERECSIQRKHQKIIEEAPSPFIGVDEKLRNEICNTAVKLAKNVGYDSAGTVEFIMDHDRRFFFLEMNTRIQVEHGITEEITGIDLLTSMIQIAEEKDFGITSQGQIQKIGHAIECRICAEDSKTFEPAPGKIVGLKNSFPQGTRFDHALFDGLEMNFDFDSMIGKLMTKGHNRSISIRKMLAALNGLSIEGPRTNISLLKIILKNPTFLDGSYSTSFIEEEKPHDNIPDSINLENLCSKVALIEAINMGL